MAAPLPTPLCQRLPNEITETIIVALPMRTLLNFEVVSKTWRNFIRGNAYTSATCFRRPKNGNGHVKSIAIARSSEVLRLNVYDPYNYSGIFRSRTPTAVILHPVLELALGSSILPTGIFPHEIFINATLLFELTNVLHTNTKDFKASGRDTFITYPPVERLELKISQFVRERGYVERRENYSYSLITSSGITFEDLFHALFKTEIPLWTTTSGKKDEK